MMRSRWGARSALLVTLTLAGTSGSRAAMPTEQRSALAPASESLVGVVVASQVLDLVSQVEGRLAEVKVRLGERVTAGQVLAVLELEPLRLELASRQANVRAAEAELQRASLLLAQARQRLEREQRIREHSAAEALESAKYEVALAESNRALAEARLSEARTRQEQASRDQENARLRAPFSGHVTEQYLVPGRMVSRAMPVVRLANEELRLRFAVPERLASLLRTGSRVEVKLSSLGLALSGTVDRISPEVDPASRHLKAEARLDVPMALHGRIPTGLLADVVLAPESAPEASRGTP